MDPEDLQDTEAYPLVVETEKDVMYCYACDVHDSRQVTDSLTP